jgi:hypothetical protein
MTRREKLEAAFPLPCRYCKYRGRSETGGYINACDYLLITGTARRCDVVDGKCEKFERADNENFGRV